MISEEEKAFIIEHYPDKGKLWCCEQLNLKECQVRGFAAKIKLRINHDGEHFKDFQTRAAKSKIGRKRPIQSAIMKKRSADGLIKQCFSNRTPEQIEKQRQLQISWYKTHEHPRGMAGKPQTEKSKQVSRETLIRLWADPNSVLNSEKYKQESSDRQSKYMNEKLIKNPGSVYSRSKKGTIEMGGKKIFARSTWEANIAAYFELLKSKGEILDWEHEPETYWFLKIKRGVRSYKPDFRITNNDGSQYFEEVKGWMDAKSKTKLNRMRIYYPEITVKVLGKDRYNQISKSKGIIPNWGLLG